LGKIYGNFSWNQTRIRAKVNAVAKEGEAAVRPFAKLLWTLFVFESNKLARPE